MNNLLFTIFGVVGFIVALTIVLMYIPLPIILLICVIGGAIVGWKYEGRKIEEEERPRHPVDDMTDEEKQRMYEEWRNKK